LSPRAIDGLYAFQLAELLVFSGQENVALRRPIKSSSQTGDVAGAWDERFLTDGSLPYLMDSAQGSQSLAYVSPTGSQPTMTIDLGTPHVLNRIHLHAVDQSDTVPQAYAGDLGIPRHLHIEGANHPNFNEAVLLLDYIRDTIVDTGPIMMWRIPETTCRFVRLVTEESDNSVNRNATQSRIGFAEIELFSRGRNVALGKPVQASSAPGTQYRWSAPELSRSLGALTDGNNLYGQILPTRDWLEELARRHTLETQRPILVKELTQRYTRQKANLRRMGWLTALLCAGIVFTILVERIIRMRQMTRIKEQFAADLHDELGANLHSIGLLTDLAKEAVDSPEELNELLDRTRVFTDRSAMAARYCTNILEAKGFCEDIVEEMRRAASRLLADLDYDLSFHGEQRLQGLKPRKRIDLFFFYKECLHNIIRHSGATSVSARLTADPKRIRLTVTDNGHGLNGDVPGSLKRRARLLGAKLDVGQPEAGGALITLILKVRSYGVFK